MDARLGLFKRFESSGKELINAGHFMSKEILDKISHLNTRKDSMIECWTLREEIYNQHMDYLLWTKDTNAIESWMSSREPHIVDSNFGSDIDEVEELLKKHKDFEGAVLAKEDDLQTVHRITMIE